MKADAEMIARLMRGIEDFILVCCMRLKSWNWLANKLLDLRAERRCHD